MATELIDVMHERRSGGIIQYTAFSEEPVLVRQKHTPKQWDNRKTPQDQSRQTFPEDSEAWEDLQSPWIVTKLRRCSSWYVWSTSRALRVTLINCCLLGKEYILGYTLLVQMTFQLFFFFVFFFLECKEMPYCWKCILWIVE